MLDARNTTVCGKYTRGLTDFTMKICDILHLYIYTLVRELKYTFKTSFPPKTLIFLVLVIYNFRTNGISD